MTHEVPTYIGFEEYSEHVPGTIPIAVQQATDRFLKERAARVAELPQWEELRQIGFEGRAASLLKQRASHRSPKHNAQKNSGDDQCEPVD